MSLTLVTHFGDRLRTIMTEIVTRYGQHKQEVPKSMLHQSPIWVSDMT